MKWLRAARDDLDSSAMQLRELSMMSPEFPKVIVYTSKEFTNYKKKCQKFWFNRGRLNPRRGKTRIFKIYFIEYL